MAHLFVTRPSPMGVVAMHAVGMNAEPHLLGARQLRERRPVAHRLMTRRSVIDVVAVHAAPTYPFMTHSSETHKAKAHAAAAPRPLHPSETREAMAYAAVMRRSVTPPSQPPTVPALPRATGANLTFRPPTRSSKTPCWIPESSPPPELSAIVSSARYSVSQSVTPSRLRHSTDAPARSPQ